MSSLSSSSSSSSGSSDVHHDENQIIDDEEEEAEAEIAVAAAALPLAVVQLNPPQIPQHLGLPENSNDWVPDHVHIFLQWFKEEYATETLNVEAFRGMGGIQLKSLTEAQLKEKAPFVGDLIYNFFHLNE
ncbi:uncharacterized protein [Oscarella lobularis]|uniref:uncharacterized protein n=1 Tax=Oscarella lobularis TaxID=121494 RepID=UPI0033137EF7